MTEFTGMNLDDAVALRHRRRQERSKPIAQEIGRIATPPCQGSCRLPS